MVRHLNTSSNKHIKAIISKFELKSLLLINKNSNEFSKYNLISISNDNFIAQDEYKKFNSVLRIHFREDIDEEIIKKIINFSNKDNIIVHCDAGESRSAAVAMAITYIKCLKNSFNCNFDDFIKECSILQNERYTPNMAVFKKIVNYYKRHYIKI